MIKKNIVLYTIVLLLVSKNSQPGFQGPKHVREFQKKTATVRQSESFKLVSAFRWKEELDNLNAKTAQKTQELEAVTAERDKLFRTKDSNRLRKLKEKKNESEVLKKEYISLNSLNDPKRFEVGQKKINLDKEIKELTNPSCPLIIISPEVNLLETKIKTITGELRMLQGDVLDARDMLNSYGTFKFDAKDMNKRYKLARKEVAKSLVIFKKTLDITEMPIFEQLRNSVKITDEELKAAEKLLNASPAISTKKLLEE